MTQGAVLLSLVLLIAVLIHGRIQTGTAFVLLALGYYSFGLIDLTKLLQNYVEPSLITLVLLMLISVALEKTLLIERVGERLMSGAYPVALARMMVVTASFSAFLNNTAVVASLLGVVSKNGRFAPSRLLLPLSYAALFGGVITLVGTSTNLVVNSFAVRAGMEPIGMFDFAWVGLPVALVCTVVVVVLARWLLPEHESTESRNNSYFLEASIQPDSPLTGRSVLENGLRQIDGLFLAEVVRTGHLISPVGPQEILEAGDILIFTGEVDKVHVLERFPGLKLFEEEMNIVRTNLVEVVVVADSPLVDNTIRDVNFRALFDAAVVGIRRGQVRLSGKLGEIHLKAGDAMMLAVGADFANRKNLDRNFYVLKGGTRKPRLSMPQSYAVFAAFAGVILLGAFEVIPLVKGLALLLIALLFLRLIDVAELRRRFPFELVLVIGSALAMSQVMASTGVADLIAGGLHSIVGGNGPLWALVAVFVVTLILTELMSNNAAAALVFPIAFSLAQSLGVSPLPFVMALAFGASASFITPFGYQTHLMVFTPGRYCFMDFVRMGLPVSLAYSVTALLLLPWAFPFHPQ
ncbi:MAG: SLC13 family permease [Gammaproteobacteria bacterium 28-57-27]|nr:MAG: SLC13 family permease [Gammaproteobacteria bacterium 28-57-27]